jgi:arylsulfatase A-like enzyme
MAGAAAGLVLIVLAAGIVHLDAPAEPRPNVVLISIDTLRADHLGYEGYERDTSPNLDRLAARARRYREAFAPAPWTLPSHAALLTGVHPQALGILDRNASLPASAPRLAVALREAGYQTAAFVDSMPRGFVGAERGFGSGFARYVHLPAESREGFHYDTAKSVDRALAWLSRAPAKRPFFLFLHTKSVHALPSEAPSPDPRHFPYDKPEPWRSRYLTPELAALTWDDPELGQGVSWLRGWNESVAAGERRPKDLSSQRIEALVALYDAGIHYVDHHLGRLFQGIAAAGHGDDTIVIVTADHGEAFGEHELLLHKELHRELLHVPLLVALPGESEGRDVAARVSLLDVAPTLLALVGLPVPSGISGQPLPANDSGSATKPLFSYYRSWPDGYYEAYGLRDDRFSLVHRRLGRGRLFETFLYDLSRDPHEREPLGREAEEQRQAWLAALRGHLERADGASPARIELDDQTLRHLEALGYVEAPDAFADPSPNPGRATDSSSRP